jgi:2,4-dienoyl-CoA reductase (NADPH2)
VFDPIGGPIAVALAEDLGDRAILVTQDQIAGNELARTGDLAPANVRLQQRGVRIERRSLLRVVRPGDVELEDRFTGTRRTVTAAAVVDCGYRRPDEPWPEADVRAGDCVAPRTLLEAILEGRRAALGVN